ncbi:MAG: 4Fe-4S dicluster domain-containing protein [Synergistaceae bacterium]|nr:4Fe-4S dicluster domain-containing protein [Synergistaceae bacterium]MBP9958050.1 4Fe-4S dicluster domain-containing protein [Synergistaceae bacterium]
MVYVRVNDCKGCGICLSLCPVGILKFSKEYNSRGVHYPEVTDAQKCTSCENCMIYCPDFAMVVRKNA